MKRLVLIAGIVAALAVGFLLLGNSRSAEGPGHASSVTAAARPAAPASGGPQAVPVLAARAFRRDLRQVLEVAGTLRTDEDVQVGARIAGRVVEVTVREGDRVRQGQVLVRLDDREIRAQLARARGALAAARARLSLARNQSVWKDTSARSDYEKAQAALVAARSRLQQAETNLQLIDTETRLRVETAQSGVRVATERLSIARELTRKQELRQAQLAVDQAKAQLHQAQVDRDNARQVFERRKTLFQQDAIAKEEVDEAERRYKTAEAAVQVAQAAVATAEEKLDLAREGSRAEEVRIAEGQLAAAVRNLEQANSDRGRVKVAQDEVETARSALRQAEAAVKAAEAGLVQNRMSQDEIAAALAAMQQARADIAYYETQLADLTIRAPVSGVVSVRRVNVGEMVGPSTPLMDLVALDAVYFEAQVPELDVARVRPGMAAQVTVDALPGVRLRGVVREVIPVADPDSRSFRVRVAVPGGRGRLPAGGYARAVVEVGVRPGALVVRKDAVQTETGDTFVWLIAPGREGGLVARRQPVTVGLTDAQYAEILNGLRPGQRVIAAGSPAIIEGTPVTVSGER